MFLCCTKQHSRTEQCVEASDGLSPGAYLPDESTTEELQGHRPELLSKRLVDGSLAWDTAARRAALRTFHSLLATGLYLFFAWGCIPRNVEGSLKLFVGLLLALPLATAYHLFSFNKAGVYYAHGVEMFTRLPQHVVACTRRFENQDRYAALIEEEHDQNIFRTVDACETGVLFLVAFFLQGLLPTQHWVRVVQALSFGNFWHSLPHSAVWWSFWGCLFFLLHRTLGANVLHGRWCGLMQPSGMWRFVPAGTMTEGCVICGMAPCVNRPDHFY
jgi:hypothetical protein